MSSSPPTNSSVFDGPEDKPRLSDHDLHYLRSWHESANIQEAAEKAAVEVRTMQNKLQWIRTRLRVQDDAGLREYINRNGWPEPFPAPPPPPPQPPPSREFNELVARRKLAWEELETLADPSVASCQKLGLDLHLLHSSPGAYTHEWFKWSDVWPGGEFRPRSPDEALLALLLRRSFREIEGFCDGPPLLITLGSQDPRVDAEARGRIFWALELEPAFAYWSDHEAPLPRRPPQVDSRFLPGGSEFPRTLLRRRQSNLYTDLPYIFPNGMQRPSPITHALGRKSGLNLFLAGCSQFSFSIGDWEAPDEVTVRVGRSYGPLCGHGGSERLHRNGTSWRSVVLSHWVS